MSVKSEMLRLLEANRDRDLSGEQIAGELGVTRAAVWKAVKSLQEDGYEITAAGRRGYRLAAVSDRLSAEGIGVFLHKNCEIVVLPETDSTNEEIKRRALGGAGEGLVVLAERQSAGKGRRGRGFFSPEGSGIYLSVLLRPRNLAAGDIVLVTTQAAVAVAHAVSEVCRREAQIKWVNDVFLDGKKICGILTEAVSDFESGGIDLVTVGIGINVYEPKAVPEELKDILGYIFKDEERGAVSRNALAAAVIDALFSYYEALPERTHLEEYRRRSNVIGHEVCFGMPSAVAGQPGDDWRQGRAVAVDDDGGLVVELPDGTREVLHTGEISLRVTV